MPAADGQVSEAELDSCNRKPDHLSTAAAAERDQLAGSVDSRVDRDDDGAAERDYSAAAEYHEAPIEKRGPEACFVVARADDALACASGAQASATSPVVITRYRIDLCIINSSLITTARSVQYKVLANVISTLTGCGVSFLSTCASSSWQ